MRLKFNYDNALFLGLLLLFGSSPIAYLLGGVYKWVGLILGFGLILFSAVRKSSYDRVLMNSLGFIIIAITYFIILEFISLFNNHYSVGSLQNIIFSIVSFFLFLSGYLISKCAPSLKEMKSSVLELIFSIIFILASIKYIEYVKVLNFFVQGRSMDEGASGNPVGIAYQFSILALIFLYLFRSQTNILYKIVFLVSALFSGAVILTTESRGAVAALILGMLYLSVASLFNRRFIRSLKSKKKYFNNLVFLGLGGLVSVIMVFFAFVNDFIIMEKFDALYARFENFYFMLIGEKSDLSTQNRVDLYMHFLNRPEEWILIGEKNLSFYPHNQFLEIFIRFGLLGIPLFLASLYGAFKFHTLNFSKKFHSEEFIFMSMLFAFSYLQSQSSLGLDINRALFLSLGFMIGYILKKPKQSFHKFSA